MLIIYFLKGLVMDKRIEEMVKEGFENEKFLNELNDLDLMKKYKCYLSKKCNDEKFERIKKMFEYVKDDEKFIDFMGKEEYKKLNESYGMKEKRGEIVKVDYDGMNINEVFSMYKLGVKEVLKKGYVMEGDVYVKVGK